MIPKRIPRQFRYQAVVLMRVLAVVSEDEIGRNSLQLLENRFHLGAYKGHESVSKGLEQWASQSGGADEELSRSSCLRCPDAIGTEYDPVKYAAGVLLGQPKDGATTANFDIVGVGTNA